MNSEEDEFQRIEAEAKRRAAHELADTQVYTSGAWHQRDSEMSDPTIASWSRENDLLFQLRKLREENERLKKEIANQDAMLERQTGRIVELQEHIENFDGEDR